jgi:hypothetical protein
LDGSNGVRICRGATGLFGYGKEFYKTEKYKVYTIKLREFQIRHLDKV